MPGDLPRAFSTVALTSIPKCDKSRREFFMAFGSLEGLELCMYYLVDAYRNFTEAQFEVFIKNFYRCLRLEYMLYHLFF
jgi:hypothetical protein